MSNPSPLWQLAGHIYLRWCRFSWRRGWTTVKWAAPAEYEYRPAPVQRLDLEAARRYLAGVEALAREARTSSDPRVLIAAMLVLQRPSKSIFS